MRFVAFLWLLALPSAAFADVFTFETPSGNIQCSVGLGQDSADIICEIVNRSGPTALPAPADCTAGWGHRFVLLERGPARMECHPPPIDYSGQEIAPYGVTGRFGDITCLSSQQGFECRNADGHGFFLSRARQSVF